MRVLAITKNELLDHLKTPSDVEDAFVQGVLEWAIEGRSLHPTLLATSLSTRKSTLLTSDDLGEMHSKSRADMAAFCHQVASREDADYCVYFCPMNLSRDKTLEDPKAGFMLISQTRGRRPKLALYVLLADAGKPCGVQLLGKTGSAKSFADGGGFEFFPGKNGGEKT